MANRAAVPAGVCVLVNCAAAWGQGWPQMFEPTQVLDLHLEMAAGDWETIQSDETFTVQVPAQFWAAGEAPLLVGVRRKSATALQNGTPFKKVSLKIDVNDFVAGQRWRGLNKLSLENGDDSDVISEGLAWHLHRVASGPEGYNYEHPAALAAWVRVNINGVYTGVYLSVEQRDRRFLVHRNINVPGQTWLYKVGDIGQMTIEVGEPDSPTVPQLCYSPFEPGLTGSCPAPAQSVMIAQMNDLVHMRSLLTMGAVDRFCNNRDGILSHAKNFFFLDSTFDKRTYYPWDLDAAFAGNPGSFYWTRGAYGVLLTIPQYRAQYSQIMNDLLCGPFEEAQLHAFLNSVEPVVGPHLALDPNNRIGGQTVADFFASRRAWVTQRINTVRGEIEGYVPCPPPPAPCYANCDGSTTAPVLNVADFTCFLQKFAAGDSYANCDQSTTAPVLNVADFTCFLQKFAAGCR